MRFSRVLDSMGGGGGSLEWTGAALWTPLLLLLSHSRLESKQSSSRDLLMEMEDKTSQISVQSLYSRFKKDTSGLRHTARPFQKSTSTKTIYYLFVFNILLSIIYLYSLFTIIFIYLFIHIMVKAHNFSVPYISSIPVTSTKSDQS